MVFLRIPRLINYSDLHIDPTDASFLQKKKSESRSPSVRMSFEETKKECVRSRFSHSFLFLGRKTGLEPATSGTTIRRSNQLSYNLH